VLWLIQIINDYLAGAHVVCTALTALSLYISDFGQLVASQLIRKLITVVTRTLW